MSSASVVVVGQSKSNNMNSITPKSAQMQKESKTTTSSKKQVTFKQNDNKNNQQGSTNTNSQHKTTPSAQTAPKDQKTIEQDEKKLQQFRDHMARTSAQLANNNNLTTTLSSSTTTPTIPLPNIESLKGSNSNQMTKSQNFSPNQLQQNQSPGLLGSIFGTSWYRSNSLNNSSNQPNTRDESEKKNTTTPSITELNQQLQNIGEAGEIPNQSLSTLTASRSLQNGIINSLQFEVDSLDFKAFRDIIIEIIEKNFFGESSIVSSDGHQAIKSTKLCSNPFKMYDLAGLIMNNEKYKQKFKDKALNIDVIHSCLTSIENVHELMEGNKFYMVKSKQALHQTYISNYIKSSCDSISKIIENYGDIVIDAFAQNKPLVLLYVLKNHEFWFHRRKLKSEKSKMIVEQLSYYEKHMEKIDSIPIRHLTATPASLSSASNNNHHSPQNREMQKMEVIYMDQRDFDMNFAQTLHHLDHLDSSNVQQNKQELKNVACYGKTTIEEITFFDSTIDLINFVININAIPVVLFNGYQYIVGAKIPFDFELNKTKN